MKGLQTCAKVYVEHNAFGKRATEEEITCTVREGRQ